MSDNDDAHSEAPPEGWSSMFNKSVAGKTPQKSQDRRNKDDTQQSGWLGGWLDSKPSKSKLSSISSDTPPDAGSSSHGSDAEDNERTKWAPKDDESQDGSDSESGSLHAYEVDSDGFRKDAVKGKGSASDLDESELEASVDVSMQQEIPEPLFPVDEINDESTRAAPRSSPRRDRIRSQMIFQVTHDAAELVVSESPDTEVKGANDDTVNDKDKTKAATDATSNTVSAGSVPVSSVQEPVPWWQAMFAASNTVGPISAPAEEKPQNIDESMKGKDDEKMKTADEPEANKGSWTSFFGGAEEKPETPKSMLPHIPPPPDLPVLNEVNSFFTRAPMSDPQIELLGPAPMMRYEGRVRGWPRRMAPHWSTHQGSASQIFSSFPNSQIDGVSALAMFRVT